MTRYIIRRLLLMIPTLFFISLVVFFIIQLPPGDFLSSLIASMTDQGVAVNHSELAALKERYGLDQPVWVQYFRWIGGILFHWDFGQSFEWDRPVSELIAGRLGLTIVLALATLFASWLIALPIGIYSAVRRNAVGSHLATFFCFIGLAVPNFLLALVAMFISLRFFGESVGGLRSPQFIDAPWDLPAVVDLFSHLWTPVIVTGAAAAASLVRILRANLLDELNKPYVVTQRAMGHSEWSVILRYPVPVAILPFVSTIGWLLPSLVSGSTITAIVLNLPTTGPMLLHALLTQDMYLAGGIILLLSTLTVIGTFLSDLLLAWLDPRVRLA